MRIYSLTKIIALPIILLFLFILLFHQSMEFSSFWLIVPASLGAILLISYREIDYWYLQKNPIQLDKQIVELLNKYIPFYRDLNEEQRAKYNMRISRYVSGRAYRMVGQKEMKDVPYDIKVMIATQAIQMTFYQKDFMVGDFDHIYLYKHPFGTPRYKFLHTVETEVEDGMLIFSLEHLVHGITDPSRYYNIAMHGYVEAFIKANPTAPFPPRLNAGWEDIQAICGYTKEQILKVIGFTSADLLVVLGNCYFTYPQAFEDRLPKLKKELDYLFGVSKI